MQTQKQFSKELGVCVSHVDANKTFETCCPSCSLFNSSVIQAMAGAQQQFLQISKIQKACLLPLKMPSLKNHDPGCPYQKKWSPG
jgi:hypothetical protein